MAWNSEQFTEPPTSKWHVESKSKSKMKPGQSRPGRKLSEASLRFQPGMATPDYFDRQRRIPGWSQELISKQVCLCLGAGGLGTAVILALSRLGVRRIHVIDFDVVEPHNLNRQVLFGKADVGKFKSEQASKNASASHAIETEIVSHHWDVRNHWPEVVALAKECTVIFNMIDIGDKFDVVVQALALTLTIPLIQGGTFRTSLNLETFSGHGVPCLWCANPNVGNDFIDRCKPGPTALALSDLSFVTSDDHPTGASAVIVSVTAGQLMVTNWLNLLFFETQEENKKNGIALDPNVPERQAPFTRVFMYLDNLDIDKFMIEPEIGCLLCPGKPKPPPQAPVETSTSVSDESPCNAETNAN